MTENAERACEPPAPGFLVQCRESDPTRCIVSCSAYRAGYDECPPLSSTSAKPAGTPDAT